MGMMGVWVVPVIVGILIIGVVGFTDDVFAKQDKVTICHKPGTPAEQTKQVPQSAVSGHLGHGDFIGTCEDVLRPGDIIVADISANAIIKVDPLTGAQTIISSGGSFVGALDLWLDSDGNIIVADLDFSGGGNH